MGGGGGGGGGGELPCSVRDCRVVYCNSVRISRCYTGERFYDVGFSDYVGIWTKIKWRPN